MGSQGGGGICELCLWPSVFPKHLPITSPAFETPEGLRTTQDVWLLSEPAGLG